jgi:hypothetical protein
MTVWFLALPIVCLAWSHGSLGFAQIKFETVSDSALSPSHTRAARPDTVMIGERFYVCYLQLSPGRTFKLLLLDKKLTLLGTTDLFSGKDQPTDIRVCAGPADSFFYAFETTRFEKGLPNHLSLARYRIAGSLPILAASQTEVGQAMPVIIPDGLPRPGDDLTDDPAIFVRAGRVLVATRKWESAILKMRAFSSDLNHLETRDLDFGAAFPGLHLSVNCFIGLGGKPYLVSAVNNGPPIDRRFFSYVAAVGLDEAMTTPGKSVVLSRTARYEDSVACARYSGGMLFVGYDSREYESPRPGPSNHCGMIKAFDPENGFRETGSVQMHSGSMVDNHFTFEIVDGRLYAFYQTPNEEIRVKVMGLNQLRPDQSPKRTRAPAP